MANCQQCGCKLASDHTGRRCTPCARNNDAPARQELPPPPSGFWDRQDVRDAADEQHLGKIIHAYRCACTPPINQADMADALGVGQSQISRIERGNPPSNLRKLRNWAQLLQVPERLLWFRVPEHAKSAWPATESPPSLKERSHRPTQGDDDVKRRDALKLASAAILITPWQRLSDTVDNGRAPDQASIRLIEERATEFFHLEETTPSRELSAALIQHGRTVQQLLNNTSRSEDRQRMLSAAGETEALTGWLAFDRSQPREALRRYRTALEMAEEAGDGPLTACILNYWSYLLASQDKSAEAVEVLGRASEHVRGAAATTQAWISARQAEEAAIIGDREISERALERAFTAYDYARPHHERAWTSFFRASRLGSLAVSSYGRLGHAETDSLASSLLSSLAPTENKVRALVLADLAVSAATRADIDRADELASQSLPLALRTEASLAQDRLWELAEVLPQNTPHGTAGALRQRLTSELVTTSQA